MTTAIELKKIGEHTLVARRADEDGERLASFSAGHVDVADALIAMQEEARKHRASGHGTRDMTLTVGPDFVVLNPKQMHDLKACTDAARSRGNADANDYLHGVANGLILALAIVEGKEPEYVMSRPTPTGGYDAKVGETETTAFIGGFTPIRTQADLKPIQPEPAREYRHIDDIAVDQLATLMRAKLAQKRLNGFGGWDDEETTAAELSRMLVRHVAKGDPVDVANLCAFLSYRGDKIDDKDISFLYDVFAAAGEAFTTQAGTGERADAMVKLRNLICGI